MPWLTWVSSSCPVQAPYKAGVFAGRPPRDADHRVCFSQFHILPNSLPRGQSDLEPARQTEAKIGPCRPAGQEASDPNRIPLAVQARQTAERAIPYIEKDGTAWIKDRKCLSCHYSGYMLWSLREAGQHGFAIDKASSPNSTSWDSAQSTLKGHGVGERADADWPAIARTGAKRP